MKQAVLSLVLGMLCLGLKAQIIFTSNCGESSERCIGWLFQDQMIESSLINELMLSYQISEGEQIIEVSDWLEGPCWFCEGERGIDWDVEIEVDSAIGLLNVHLVRLKDSIQGFGLISGIIIIVDDGIGRPTGHMSVVHNLSSSLNLFLEGISDPMATLRIIHTGTGQVTIYPVSEGFNSIPTPTLSPGYYYLDIPSQPEIVGKYWNKTL
ncbi:MAG: hypothetical protein AAFP89_26400 [Bacteroidota bacterium]